jgi:Fur family ferric uptake transcriptional regulator
MSVADFREFLKERGLRFTGERAAVFRAVLRSRGHFDPDGLYLLMRKRGEKVSRSSVYRTLPLLVEAGVLDEAVRAGRQTRYERTLGREHHDHMTCLGCGRVIEFYSEAMEDLQEKICRRERFKGVSHTMEIRGYCMKCGKKAT